MIIVYHSGTPAIIKKYGQKPLLFVVCICYLRMQASRAGTCAVPFCRLFAHILPFFSVARKECYTIKKEIVRVTIMMNSTMPDIGIVLLIIYALISHRS
jgi:hypothetical protein